MNKKNLLSGLLLLGAASLSPLHADDVTWCLVTDGGEAVAMSEVSCLAASDDDSTFCVMLTSGESIQEVHRAYFDQCVPTAIKNLRNTPIVAHNALYLPGTSEDEVVRIYTLEGKLMKQTTAVDISLSDLRNGIYVLRVADKSFKFQKR